MTTLSGNVKLALLFISAIVCFGCSKYPQLAGSYHLFPSGRCSSKTIASDQLILHENGTFEQHTVEITGEHYDRRDGKWRYLGKNKIAMIGRADFFSSDTTPTPTKNEEVLEIEPSHPELIELPDGCYYSRPK